jgi:hypothetical protein
VKFRIGDRIGCLRKDGGSYLILSDPDVGPFSVKCIVLCEKSGRIAKWTHPPTCTFQYKDETAENR